MKIWAVVKFNFVGYHRWKDAKNFLKNVHRHIFYVTVMVAQKHEDREIEYIQFKEWLILKKPALLETDSCEMYAMRIYRLVRTRYQDRDITVRVMEDNENGAIIGDE